MPSKRSKVVKLGVRYLKPRARTYKLTALKSYRRRFNRAMILNSPVPRGIRVTKEVIDGVGVEWLATNKPTDRLMIYLHGGGFVLGSPRTHRGIAANIAKTAGVKVLSIDYSLAPEHPYPAALEDIEKVWRAVTKRNGIKQQHIILAGDSAGAHLALVTALRLRDQNLTLPKCLILISPALDTSFSGDTMKTNAKADPILDEKIIKFLMDAYSQGKSLDDPYLSPLRASFNSLPPILIHVGSEEVLLDDAKSLAEKAASDGVIAKLYIGEGLWHDWHMTPYIPESKTAFKDIAEFIEKYS